MKSMRNRHYATLAAVCFFSTACFEVEQVDVTRRVKVDDFEDGDGLASNESGFGPWWCYSYSTGEGEQPSASCGPSAGFESTVAESLTFSLREMDDADYPGASLLVSAAVGTRDLSSFRNLRFAAKFEPGEAAPPDGTRLLSELTCSTAEAQLDEGDPNLSIVYHGEPIEGVELPSDWVSYAIPFAAFRQNQYQTPLSNHDSCITVVDSIVFRIEPSLMQDGQAAAGTLTIDDVYLE
jgi:hypothetical protein